MKRAVTLELVVENISVQGTALTRVHGSRGVAWTVGAAALR